jgi:fibronectin-binding autotransporter adhesin
MFATWLRRLVNRKPQTLTGGRRRAKRNPSTRLRLEALEDRLAPATHIWTGPAVGGVWTNNANWTDSVNPAIHLAPTTGEAGGTIVQFNGGIDSTDDIANLVINQLHFTAGGDTVRGNGVTLGISGLAVPNNLVNDAGTNTVDASLPLDLSGTTVFALVTAGQLNIVSVISGNQGLDLVSPSAGSLEFSGTASNTYTGATNVDSGTLFLNKNGGAVTAVAIPADLIIGNSTGGAGAAVVSFLVNDDIADTATVTVNDDGLLAMNNLGDTIGALVLQNGTSSAAAVNTGAGAFLTVGNVTVTGTGTGAVGSVVTGNLNLGNATRTYSIANGTAAVDLDVIGRITGTAAGAGLTKTGAGTLQFSGGTTANDYTGPTSVNDGTLNLNKTAGTNAVAGDLVVGDGAGASPDVVSLLAANQIADTSNVTVNSDGTFDLNGNNETVASLAGTGTVTNSSATAATLTINIAGAAQFDGVLSGNLALTKAGAGTETLGGTTANTFTGTTTVNDGLLVLQKTAGVNAIPGALTIGDGIGLDEVDLGASNQIADTTVPTINSSGFLNLAGNSETVSGLIMTGGVVDSGPAGTLGITGQISATSDNSGLSAQIQGNLALSGGGGTFSVTDGPVAGAVDLVVSATITGSVSLAKNGNGQLQLAPANAANAYTGSTTVNAGALLNGAVNAVPTTSALTVAGGATYDLVGFDQQVASLAGAGMVTNSSGTAATFTVNGTAVTTFTGVLSGNLSFVKAGTGTQTLAGGSPNTYLGTTSVNDGVLILSKTPGVDAVPDGPAAVDLIIGDGVGAPQSAELRLGADDQINDAACVTVNGPDGFFNLNGHTETVGCLMVNNGGTVSGGTVTVTNGNVVVNGTSGPDTLILTGNAASITYTLNGASTTVAGATSFTFNGLDGNDLMVVDYSGGFFSLPGGISFDGGNGSDSIRVIGTGTSTGTYLPSATTQGDGTITVTQGSTDTITFTNLTPAEVSGMASFTFTTPNSDDVVSVLPGTGSGGQQADVISGTSGGVAFEALTFFNIADFTLDVGANDGANPVDNVTLGNGGPVAQGLTTFRLNTGPGNDVLAVNWPSTAVVTNSAGTDALTLTLNDGTLTLNGAFQLAADVTSNAAATTAVVNGTGTLDLPVTRTFTVADGAAEPDVDIAVTLTGAGGLTKAGPGSLRLSGTTTNTYAGPTTVNDGTLELNKTGGATAFTTGPLTIGDNTGGPLSAVVQEITSNNIPDAVSVTINSDGLLAFNAGQTDAINNLTMTGGAVDTSPTGLLTVNGTLTATSDATGLAATIDGNLQLTTGNVTVNDGPGADDLDIAAVISGAAGLTKGGAGLLSLQGASPNTFTGTTTVLDGTLELAKTANTPAVSTTVVVGDGVGGPLTAVLQLVNDGEIPATANVTINSDGLLNFNPGVNQTINNLTMTGGAVDTNTGLLTVNGTVTATSDAAGLAATIDGNVRLTTGNVVVNDGPGVRDLDVTAVISGAAGLTKSGAGTMSLTGTNANTYTGTTTVTDGTLELDRSGVNAVTGNLTVGDGVGGPLTAVAQLTSSNQIPDTATVVVNSDGLLAFNAGQTDTIGALNMTGGAVDTSPTGTLTVAGAGGVTATSDATGLAATIDGNLVVTSGIFNVGNGPGGDDLDVAANIGDNGGAGLTKNGTGRMLISGTNTYTGTTFVSDGTLALGVINGVPTTSPLRVLSPAVFDLNGFDQTVPALTGTGTVDNPTATTATLTVNNAAADTFDGVIQGNLNLTKTGAGTFTLTNNSTYTGMTTVTGGTLANGIANALPVGTMLTVTAPGTYDLAGFAQTVAGFQGNGVITDSGAAATLTTNTAVDKDFSGTLTGALALTKTGPAQQTLSGTAANTYTGVTTVNDGTLNLNKTGVVAVPGNLVVGDNVGGALTDVVQVSQSQQIADTASVTVNSDGLLVIVAPATAETIGPLTLNGGNVDTTAATLTVTGTVTATSDPGGLAASITGKLALGAGAGVFVVNDGSGTDDLDVFADISGATGLTKLGAGRMVIAGTDTYTGGTNVVAGVLANGVVNGIPVDTALVVNPGGTFDLSGFDQQLSVIAGAGTITNSTGTLATLTVNDAADDTYAGLLTGNLALTKINTGTLTLTGNNSYTGATNVNVGRLIVNGVQPNSPITVTGTAVLGGTGVTGTVTTNAAGASVSPGLPAGTGSQPGILTTGSVNFNPGTFVVNINGTSPGTGYDVLNVNGTVNIAAGSTLTLVYAANTPVGATFNILNNDGSDPIVGTFANFGQGAQFMLGGQLFQISYTGGDGNDIVLTRLNTNPAVTVNPPGDQSAFEGTPKTFDLGTFSDPDPDMTFSVRVKWGDNTPDTTFTVTAPPPGNANNLTITPQQHTYADNVGSPFTVTVTVTDPNGGSGSASFHVNVANVAPVITPPANQVVNENTPTSFNLGSFTDPGADAPWTVTVQWNDPNADGTPTAPAELQPVTTFQVNSPGTIPAQIHNYRDNGVFTVMVTVRDKDGATDTKPFVITVNNVAPKINNFVPTSPTTQDEDQQFSFRLFFTERGPLDTLTVRIDWGDGTVNTAMNIPPTTTFLDVGHIYDRSSCAFFIVSAAVIDKDGGMDQTVSPLDNTAGTVHSGLVQSLDQVRNVTPQVVNATVDPNTGRTIVDGAALFTFQDAGDNHTPGRPSMPTDDPGAPGDYEVFVQWGDGTANRAVDPTIDPTVVGQNFVPDPFNRSQPRLIDPATGQPRPALQVVFNSDTKTFTVVGTHVYTLPQRFQIRLLIRDTRCVLQSPPGQRTEAPKSVNNNRFLPVDVNGNVAPATLNIQVIGAVGGQSLLSQIFIDTIPSAVVNGNLASECPPPGMPAPPQDQIAVERNVFTNVVKGNGLKFDPSLGLPQMQLDQLRLNTVQQVLGSREFLTREVRAFYREIFGPQRDPLLDPNGQLVFVPHPTADNPAGEDVTFAGDPAAAGWVQFLAQTGSISQFRQLLLGSDEFFRNRAGSNNRTFVQLLYCYLLGRGFVTDMNGRDDGQGWIDFLDRIDRQPGLTAAQRSAAHLQVVMAIADSPEAARFAVLRLYKQYFGNNRQLDAGANGFIIGLQNHQLTETQVLLAILSSPEYAAKSSSAFQATPS